MGTWELDLTTDTSVRSLRHDQIFGYTTLQEEWGNEKFLACLVPEDAAAIRKAYEDRLRDRRVDLRVPDPLARHDPPLD